VVDVRPGIGGEAGRGGAEDATRPDGGGEAGQGGEEGAARPGADEERRAYGAAPEQPTSQVVEEVDPVPELKTARDEGAAVEPAVMLAQVVAEPA